MSEDALLKKWKVLALSGRLDALTGTGIEQACHAALQQVPHLALDLRNVNYMSSAGLRVLLSSLKLATAKSGAFALIAPQANVREVLEMSGFTKIILVVDDAASLL